MPALREVFARFGIEFDRGPLQQGDQAVASMTDRLRQLGAVVAGAAVVQGTRAFVHEMAAIGDELDKTSKVIGIASADLQSWRHAANLSGVSAGDFSNSLVRLQRMTYDASEGNKAARDAFQALGVSVTDASGELRPVQDILSGMADGLQALENPSERVALLNTLMGRSGARLGPLFADGSAGVQAMRAELEALGGGASQEFIQSAADITDAFARQDLAILSLKTRLGTLLLPVIERATEALTEMLAAVSKLADDSYILEIALGVVTAALVVYKRAAIQAGLASARAMLPALLTFGLVAAGIALVTLLVEDMFVAFQGGDSVFEDWINYVTRVTAAASEQDGIMRDLAFTWSEFVRFIEEAIALLPRLTNYLGLTAIAIDENATGGQVIDSFFRDDRKVDPAREAAIRQRREANAAAAAAAGDTRTPAERVRDILQAQEAGASPRQLRAAAGPVAGPTAPEARGGRRGGGTVIQQTVAPNINISGQGLDERAVAREVEQGVRRAMDAANASALEDLEPQGGD